MLLEYPDDVVRLLAPLAPAPVPQPLLRRPANLLQEGRVEVLLVLIVVVVFVAFFARRRPLCPLLDVHARQQLKLSSNETD